MPRRSKHRFIILTGTAGYDPAEMTLEEWREKMRRLPSMNAKEHHERLRQQMSTARKTAVEELTRAPKESLKHATRAHLLCCDIHRRPAHQELVDSLQLLADVKTQIEGLPDDPTALSAEQEPCIPPSEELYHQVTQMKAALEREKAQAACFTEAASQCSGPLSSQLFTVIINDPGVADTGYFTRVTATVEQFHALWERVQKVTCEAPFREVFIKWLQDTHLLESIPSGNGILGEEPPACDGASTLVTSSGISVFALSSERYHQLTGNRDADTLTALHAHRSKAGGEAAEYMEAKAEVGSLSLSERDKIRLKHAVDFVYSSTRVETFIDPSGSRSRFFNFRRIQMAQAEALRCVEGVSTFDTRQLYFGQRWHATRGYLGEFWHRPAGARKIPCMILFGDAKFKVKSNTSGYKSTPTSSLAKAFSHHILVVMVDEVGALDGLSSPPRHPLLWTLGACMARDSVCVFTCVFPLSSTTLASCAYAESPPRTSVT